MKECTKCKETKGLEEFNNNKQNKDGKHSYCKVCHSVLKAEWYRNNKERVKVRKAEWQRNNKERHNALNAKYRAKAQPCVYRIKNKTSGHYYLGQTSQHFCERVTKHFSTTNCLESPFTGLNKEEWKCEVLCYGTNKQVKHLEKVLLNTRVGKDPLCLNKNTW